jgi:phenylalanyl-tRNA synthetase beta chain
MKISYQWLLELTGLDWSVEEVAERLTLSGSACEDIESMARYMDKVVVGEVLEIHPVEGADKIVKTLVTDGSEKYDVICGAPNVAVGQKIPFAQIGAELAGDMKIRKAKIRGVESFGMICSESELGISEDHSGIMVLDESAKPGQALIDHLSFDDYILDLELTPDRADSMSAIGIARDLAAIAGVKLRYPEFELKETGDQASEVIKVAIDDVEACPRFTARIIRNVSTGESPWWMKRRLIASGMRPISNVVDVTNYVMLETGNPVHSFDLDRFASDQVLVRRASKAEKLRTLDDVEHKLTDEVLLITDGKRARAAAGVMGGHDSEVTDDTKNILLEVAYFSPPVIRRSRKSLGIISEASQRFEKGVDPNNLPTASARVSHLLHDLCGGEVLSGIVDCYPNEIKPHAVSFRPERCNKILGTSISAERMTEIFHGLEFSVNGSSPMEVTAATYRHDIVQEIDLIEEVARIEGYDAVPNATENVGPLFTPRHYRDRFETEVRQVLTGAGFDEMISHGLAHSKMSSALNPDVPQLRVMNPVSEELDIMRNSLVSTAVSVTRHNFAHRNMNLQMFEIGKAYFPPDEKGEWIEEERLLLMATGESEGNWRDKPRTLDFHDVSGALSRLCEHFQWPTPEYEDGKVAFLDDEVSFTVRSGDTALGVAGLLSSKLGDRFDLKQPVYLAEVRLGELIEQGRADRRYHALPTFPAAPRDLAIVIDDTVRVGEMVARVSAVAGELAEEVRIFDLYAGKQIGGGKKSVGVSIVYRSPERSLKSSEVDEIQQDIVAMLKREFNAEIREK